MTFAIFERGDPSAPKADEPRNSQYLPGGEVIMNSRIIVILLAVTFVIIGCEQSSSPIYPPAENPGDLANDRLSITNDPVILGSRITLLSTDVPIDNSSLYKNAGRVAFSLTLVAEIDPPTVQSQVVQATSVDLKSSVAVISYNMRGTQYLGAVDFVNLKGGHNAEIRSSVAFADADINAVTWDGSFVYVAEASSDTSLPAPGCVERLFTVNGWFTLTFNDRYPLTSYAGTGAFVWDNTVYLTTGNTGGLHTFSKTPFLEQNAASLDDARWVARDNTYLAVVQGTPGRVTVYKNGVYHNTFPFDGSRIAESKSTVEVLAGKAIIAAGDGGVKIMNLETGTIVGSLPRAVVAGLDTSVTVTNAVSAYEQYIFISNGEAGVYVALASTNLNNATGDQPITLTLLGRLQFGQLQSVNHVVYDGKYLIVAAGLGGVKVVQVNF